MSVTTAIRDDSFVWQPQPQAAALLRRLLGEFASDSPDVTRLASRLLNETGTRLTDWIDHLVLPADDGTRVGNETGVGGGHLADELAAAGFAATPEGDAVVWRHAGGMFPAILTLDGPVEKEAHGRRLAIPSRRLAINVESVDEFVAAQRLDHADVHGAVGGRFRTVIFAEHGVSEHRGVELMAVERHGYDGFGPTPDEEPSLAAAARHHAAFERRQRQFDDVETGFKHTHDLIAAAIDELGVDWACDLFFAAERHFWQSRNHAGQIQKARQDALGLGWGNHDHHTYRSSRGHFTKLIALLEQLGFVCRERFHAGEEAGWGAQVLEHPVTGIAVFADVDLLPEEVAGDFAHEPLAPLPELGTIGLWCALHGEAILEAGLHHLECRFDFDAARAQLAAEGIETMAPFTDMPHLKQAFTAGETWPVLAGKISAALAGGQIDNEQAESFRENGALGSHLEILQRTGGYKGFNQTGISHIIRETDPRR